MILSWGVSRHTVRVKVQQPLLDPNGRVLSITGKVKNPTSA